MVIYTKNNDIYIINSIGNVVTFANIWYDSLNKIGILEPVGVIPEYRKMELGKAVIYEVINRAAEL